MKRRSFLQSILAFLGLPLVSKSEAKPREWVQPETPTQIPRHEAEQDRLVYNFLRELLKERFLQKEVKRLGHITLGDSEYFWLRMGNEYAQAINLDSEKRYYIFSEI